LSGDVNLIARTVAWPDGARVMTSGATGAGGPSIGGATCPRSSTPPNDAIIAATMHA